MGFGSSLSLQPSDFDEVLTSSNYSGDVFQLRAGKTLQEPALQQSESKLGHGGCWDQKKIKRVGRSLRLVANED